MANRKHPLVKLALESQWKDPDQLSDLQRFALYAVGDLCCENTYITLREQKPPPLYLKYLGQLYIHLPLQEIPLELRPPYKIWVKEKGILSVDENILKEWAASKIPKED